jgi:hypothetical protein
MLIVETIAKIRRLFFVQGKPIKAICRELRLSRKVVRKVLRSKATEFHYERETQPLPKIGPWIDRLDQLLSANEAKVARERLTLIRLFEELCGLGYDGGYDAVRRYARRKPELQRFQATVAALRNLGCRHAGPARHRSRSNVRCSARKRLRSVGLG